LLFYDSLQRVGIPTLLRDLTTGVLLFTYDELSHEGITAVLGCTRKSVEMHLCRARKLRRHALAP
jgi:DNA-directed RNA polymerase specialized sigma24 family protein